MPYCFRHLFAALIFLLAVLFPSFAAAQQKTDGGQSVSAEKDDTADPDQPPKAVGNVSEEAIAQLTQNVNAASDLPEEVRRSVLNKLKAASDSLARIKKLHQQMQADQKAIADAAVLSQKLRGQLSEKTIPLEELINPEATLADLVAKLATLQPELQKASDNVKRWEAEPARRSERRGEINSELTSQPTAVATLMDQLAKPAAAAENPFEVDARQMQWKAQLQELEVRVPAFKTELSRYDAEKAGDVVNLQLQLAQRNVARLEQQTSKLTQLIAERRRADARYVADQLLAFANGAPAPSPYQTGPETLFEGALTQLNDLKLAGQTAELAATNVDVTADVAETTKEVTTARSRLEKIREQVAVMYEKIDRVSLTGAIGLELRRDLKALPDTRSLVVEGRLRQTTMQEVEFNRLELSGQLKSTADQLAKIRGNPDDSTSETELRLLIDSHETLKKLTSSYIDYFDRLSELDVAERELIREIEDYRSFIREQVLWIRSNRSPGLSDLSELKGSVRALFDQTSWQQVVERLWADMQSRTWAYFAFAFLVTLLLSIQNRFRRNLDIIAATAGKPTCRTFRITIRALVLTVVLAAAWPCLPAFTAWRLLQEDVNNVFIRGLGEGLKAFSIGFFTLNLMRHLCRPTGLGPVHFGWNEASAQMLRRYTYRLMWFLLPLLFSKAMLHALSLSAAQVLERLVFVAGLMVLAWYEVQVLHPDRGVFATWLKTVGGWIYQLRWVAFVLIIGLPLALAAMAIAGFYYTAYELSWRLNVMILLSISLFVLRSFLMRLFLVQHRQLRMEQAKAKRRAIRESAEHQPDLAGAPVVDEVVDLKEVSSQTQRLCDSAIIIGGLLLVTFVWADVHPAFSILDKWTVWSTTVQESVAYVDESDGSSKVRLDQTRVPITVADCLISFAILLLTMTAVRNLPGFLEITVLQRLPIEPSIRYAIRMVSRYLLVVIGTLLAFANIGIGWDKVQWLAAALTVGLGFGLQEIFANFISGLIILFERPIRISDVVTIGDVSGTVSQIRMRATTITDWDLKEYIVPNKEFITGRLLNWTLSDRVNRVVVNVGVAYGSDTEKARALLVEAANEIPEILAEPAPLATFEEFGDSTLNLILRCYLPTLENRLQTITKVHEAIDAKFKAAKIEIAFPQVDLHVVDIPSPS